MEDTQQSGLDICAREFIKSRTGIQPIVVEKLNILLSRYPEIRRVCLVGSYANGTWVDETTPQWFKDYRVSIGKRKRVSDVDFYTEPWVPPSEGDYDILDYLRSKKILIYDNGKTII